MSWTFPVSASRYFSSFPWSAEDPPEPLSPVSFPVRTELPALAVPDCHRSFQHNPEVAELPPSEFLFPSVLPAPGDGPGQNPGSFPLQVYIIWSIPLPPAPASVWHFADCWKVRIIHGYSASVYRYRSAGFLPAALSDFPKIHPGLLPRLRRSWPAEDFADTR